MASLYEDKKSPYWFLRYKGKNGKWCSKSTRFRIGIGSETQKAREMCAKASLDEARMSPTREIWGSWVPAYLEERYRDDKSLKRAKSSWLRLSTYLKEKGILYPQDLTYIVSRGYFGWRTAKNGFFKPCAHNTALLELKFLGVICGEAVKRGIISTNPAAKLGIGRVRGKIKPELSDDDIAKIRNGLKDRPEWMSNAFEIALHQGCRLRETAVFKDDVELKTGRIHFRKTKGDKPFTVLMNPALVPLLRKLVKNAAGERIFELPASAGREFHRILKKLGMKDVTFHCTRVTVASRLARGGYSQAKAMRLLNHSSTLVHQTYQRLQAEDVSDAYDVLRIPKNPENKK